MNKLAFVSDIHGNFPAWVAVLNDIKSRGIEKIVCLGDLVGYYSQINEVIDSIAQECSVCLMGNHDYALVFNQGTIERSRTCTNVLHRQLSYITAENLAYLRNLPESVTFDFCGERFLCVHGGLNDKIDEYVGQIDDSYFDRIRGEYSFLITAHSHIPVIKSFNQIVFANSGSVGQPRDHDPRSSYLLFEDHRISVIRVPYDVNATRKAMRERGFEDYISEVLYKGYRIGEKNNDSF